MTLRVRTAADLFAGLRSGELARHLAMLGAVSASPARAMGLGRDEGRDVIDVILELLDWRTTTPHRCAILECLTRFEDPRVGQRCREILERPGPLPARRLAARWLGRPGGGGVEILRRWLMQDREPQVAVLAAEALAGASLPWPEQIRAATAAPWLPNPGVPPVSSDTGVAWLAALRGPFGEGAQLRLVEQGRAAFQFLVTQWDTLPEVLQLWVIDWGGRAHPDDLLEHFEGMIEAAPHRVQELALGWLARQPGAPRFQGWLRQFRDHPDAAVLLAAVQAGLRGLDWPAVMRHSDHRGLRLVAVGCLAETRGVSALPALLEALGDASWQVRAAAAQALARLGSLGASAAEPFLEDASPGVRAAAAQVCLAQGRSAA